MTLKYDDPNKKEEEDIVISDAIPAGPDDAHHGPPVLAGHNRFYCEKCRTVRLTLSYVLSCQEGAGLD
jgi:hypothetical protein